METTAMAEGSEHTCYGSTTFKSTRWCLSVGLSEPVTDDVRAAGTGWFTALMLLLVIALVAVGVITAIKCRIGAIYPGQYPPFTNVKASVPEYVFSKLL